MMRKYLILIPFALMNQFAAAQSDDEQERNKYSLFNPVPKEKMRDMETDRPDVTESAYTVDAGHFQYETDLFKTIRNREDGVLNVSNVYNHANLKLGVTNTTDFQVVIESVVQNTTINNVASNSFGFGDITLRVKQSLWGNNGGKTALAMMPYLNLPTSKFSENSVEGGIVFPLAVELNSNWGLGMQTAFDLLKNKSDKNYSGEILYSITASRGLSRKLDFFTESYSTYNFKDQLAQVSVNGGLVYSISDNFRLDSGFNYGITKATDKVYFAGFSFRY
jgi:hypothetical protein